MYEMYDKNLHSNMVRFIIFQIKGRLKNKKRFTFQYGQIYYSLLHPMQSKQTAIYIPIWLDLLSIPLIFQNYRIHNLHSNMVRFIMPFFIAEEYDNDKFTFQYGQIYYYDFTET